MRGFINVTRQKGLFSKIKTTWAAPLSNTYPAVNFRTAGQAQQAAPGSPNQGRVYSPSAGDIRAQLAGGYSGIYASAATKKLLESIANQKQQPASIMKGGSNFNLGGSGTASSNLLIPLAILAVVIWIFFT